MTKRRLKLSASQHKQFKGCQRRWGYVRIEGQREPQGDAAAKGSGHHKEMEDWGRFAKMPETRPALKAMQFAPPPGVAELEVPIYINTPGGPWIGFIDSAYNWEFGRYTEDGSFAPCDVLVRAGCAGRAVPVAPGGITVIQDWKFTGNIKNAKEAAELRTDVAVNAYAFEAFAGGAVRVLCRWVYIQMTGSPTHREVWFEVFLDDVLEILEAADADAEQAQALYQANDTAAALPRNTSHCYSFGRRCPFYEQCAPEKSLKMPTGEPEPMSDAFKASLTASFPKSAPPLPAKAPALPATAKKAPPPLPKGPTPGAVESIAAQFAAITGSLTQLVDAEPVVESGFMNSPEAPVEPAVSPEDAVVKQQIAPPPPPPKDDLDDMTDEQLKELGMALGAFDRSNKARRPGRIGMIRAKRMELGAAAPSVDTQYIAEKLVEKLVSELSENTAQKSGVKSAIEEPTGAEGWAAVEAAGGLEPGLRVLFINCAPTNVPGVQTLPELLETLRPAFKAATGADDYRLVDFGKGAGAMSVGLREHFAAHCVDALVVDTRTQEGMAFASTLAAIAVSVVRGF